MADGENVKEQENSDEKRRRRRKERELRGQMEGWR